MIYKEIQNTIIFTLLPLIGIMIFYFWVRFDYSFTTLNKIDFTLIPILLLAVSLYFDIIQIQKKVTYYNSLLQQRELSGIYQSKHTKKKEIIGNNKMYLYNNSIDIFNQVNECVFHYNAKENIIEIKKRFSKLKIITDDIDFLIFEYDKTYKQTLKGLLTRAELDKIQSIGIIAAKLFSGKKIPLVEIVFDQTLFSNKMDNLYQSMEEDEFNFSRVGLKATKILSNVLQKKYLVVNFKNAMLYV